MPVAGGGPDVLRLSLRVLVCRACWLCQLDPAGGAAAGDAAGDAAGAVCHPAGEAGLADCRRRAMRLMSDLRLGPRSLVEGTGPQDQPLLSFFRGAGVPVGPAGNPGAACPDLICSVDGIGRAANPNAFAGGLAARLVGDAVALLEMPHLLALIGDGQFDRISHARPLYLSLLSLEPVLARAGLRVFDAESRPVGGGTLGVMVCRSAAARPERGTVALLRDAERAALLDRAEGYQSFGARAASLRDRLVDVLTSAHHGRKTVAVLGPADRAATLLNACGAAAEQVAYVADDGALRQGATLPGTRVAVFDIEELRRRRPDFVLILSADERAEVMTRLADLRRLGTRFVTAFPDVSVTA